MVKYLLGAHRVCVTQAVCSSMSGSFYTYAGGKEGVTLDGGPDPAEEQCAGVVTADWVSREC